MYPLITWTRWPIRSLEESINSSATGRGRGVCGLLLNIKLEYEVGKRQEEHQLTGLQRGGRVKRVKSPAGSFGSVCRLSAAALGDEVAQMNIAHKRGKPKETGFLFTRKR